MWSRWTSSAKVGEKIKISKHFFSFYDNKFMKAVKYANSTSAPKMIEISQFIIIKLKHFALKRIGLCFYNFGLIFKIRIFGPNVSPIT